MLRDLPEVNFGQRPFHKGDQLFSYFRFLTFHAYTLQTHEDARRVIKLPVAHGVLAATEIEINKLHSPKQPPAWETCTNTGVLRSPRRTL